MLLVISLDGQVLEEISVLGLIYHDRMEGLLPTGIRNTSIATSDPLHLNDVEVLSPALAPNFAGLNAGDVMISMRVPNLIVIFDPDSRKMLWHQTGPWLRQHDPDFRDDGTISIFDNRGIEGDEAIFGGSRIVTIDPSTRDVREAFPPNEANHFFTPTRGRHQNLNNGNTLLVETSGGRVLEVDAGGRPVWSYINSYDDTTVGKIQEAIRYPKDYLDAVPAACEAERM
jgi:hypothetical protein